MNACALRSAANDGACLLAAATGLPAVTGCAATARSGDFTFDKNIRRCGSNVFVEVAL